MKIMVDVPCNQFYNNQKGCVITNGRRQTKDPISHAALTG